MVALLCWARPGRPHVSLTWPAPRAPALDFLDSIRTPGPCGLPRQTPATSLLAGSTVNITWHLGYPHRGM